MPLRLGNKGNGAVVMTRSELYKITSNGERVFPDGKEKDSAALTYYVVEERRPSNRLALPSALKGNRRKKSSQMQRFDIPPPKWDHYEAHAPRRYEVPAPSAFRAYVEAPPAFVLPPPLPEPIVTKLGPPPPAPEPPSLRRGSAAGRAKMQHSPATPSLRVEVPESRRHRPSRQTSHGSVSSAGGSSNSGSHRAHSVRSAPATVPAPARTKAQTLMIDDPSKGPMPWRKQLRFREQVVWSNADGTKTKQYYYQ